MISWKKDQDLTVDVVYIVEYLCDVEVVSYFLHNLMFG